MRVMQGKVVLKKIYLFFVLRIPLTENEEEGESGGVGKKII